LKEIYKEFLGLYWQDFEFTDSTQVQMNKNFPCPPHKDTTNVGCSILVGFGDYDGGEINIKDDETEEVFSKDIREYKGITFNGANNLHWVSPFTLKNNSNRYSLVFFNSHYCKQTADFKGYIVE